MTDTQSESVERVILTNLVLNPEYVRKVFPYLKSEYFQEYSDRTIFNHIQDFITKYNTTPTREALMISLSNDNTLDETIFKRSQEIVSSLKQEQKSDDEWLFRITEKFCQEKSIYNAVSKTIKIFRGEDKTIELGMIPKLLSDAIAVSFDSKIGHEYIEDAEKRFEFYHKKEEKIPFDLTYFNRITGGGIVNKSLTIVMGSTGSGKSLALCHFASANLASGKNVLYITLEMSEEKISERIDANLLDVNIQDIVDIPKDSFVKKINSIKNKTVGKLIVKEYPTSTANANHFRYLLNELKLKKNFTPDIIYVDYLNLCSSSRVKMSGGMNSYTYIKSIAEELRGLAVEFDVPLVSATQSNRGAWNNSDVGLENTSECISIAEKIKLIDGTEKNISELIPGDQITSQDKYKTVMRVHHQKEKSCVCVRTLSGKSIVCSKDHIFPTDRGRLSYNTGLKKGIKLKTCV